MNTDFLKTMEKFNQATVESAKRLGDIQMRTLEKLAERQMQATADYLESGVTQLKVLGESQDMQTAFTAQSRYASELGASIVEHTKKTAEVFNEAKTELTEWAQAGWKAVGAPVMPVVTGGGKKVA